MNNNNDGDTAYATQNENSFNIIDINNEKMKIAYCTYNYAYKVYSINDTWRMDNCFDFR